jgi:uncharacterized protein YcbK (DUF882 family)
MKRLALSLPLAATLVVAHPAPAIPLAPFAGHHQNLKPQLVKRLKGMAGHFGKTVVVTSGCRTPATNRGVKDSYHLRCMAADVRLQGVSAKAIVAYWQKTGGGGTGTYGCSPPHVDIGPTRTWHWPCKKKRK